MEGTSENALLIELPEYKMPNLRTVAIYVWDKVKDYMHVDSQLTDNEKETEEENAVRRSYTEEEWIDTEEIDRILEQTYFANRKKKTGWAKRNWGGQ